MTWSPDAEAALRARFGADVAGFRLVYDTEGCGCAVNGVPALWAVDGPMPGDVEADSGPLALWIDEQQSVFFDEALKLDFRPDRQSYTLASDNQTYTTRLVVEDRRARIPRKEDEIHA